MPKRIRAGDLYCGAGGSSCGLSQACEAAGIRLDLTAVNHWDTAVETHGLNFPKAKHVCADLDSIRPDAAVAGSNLDLLLASPECTNFSRARGGKPVNDQKRASCWRVVRWVEATQPRAVLVENVREFAENGPLNARGRPIKSKKGQTFVAWLQALESLGYRTAHRVLNAADYGDATTRERLFIVAWRGNKPWRWPEPTHARNPEATLFSGAVERWRAAREIIDWATPGQSIFGRKKPLQENTLKRIEAGLRRFGGTAAEPFLALLRGTGPGQVGTSFRPIGDDLAFVVPTNYGERKGQAPRAHALGDPLPAVVGSVTHGLVQPFTVKYNRTATAQDLADPLDTVTARDRFGLVQPTQCDILFRMLQLGELSAAMSFPVGYQFAGTRKADRIRQVGNAVPVRLARALCAALLKLF